MNGRIIKFRAWDKKEKEMIADFSRTNLWELSGGDETDYFVPMQYTGLKDKHGKEIYEGDIVKAKDKKYELNSRPGKIEFYKASFTILFEDETRGGILFYIPDIYEMEVIGNIYDTPSLLIEKKDL